MATQTYFDKDLKISLVMLETWKAAQTSQFPLVLVAPEEQGYTANMTFAVRTLSPATPEKLQALIDDTRKDREAGYAGFDLLEDQNLMLHGFPAHIETYHWNADEDGTALTQLFALLLRSEQALYSIHATTLRQLESTFIPQFRAVVESVRFIEETE